MLIGYGVCALTLLCAGRPIVFVDAGETWAMDAGLFLLLALTWGESTLTQWWVVRYRIRKWQKPLPDGRLLKACILARLVIAIPWTLVTPYLVRG